MDFDALKVLVATITKNKLKHIDLYNPEKEATTKIGQLYEGISTGAITDEDNAIEALFKENKDPEASYKQAKKRLVQQLINTVFFVDIKQPQFNERTKAYYLAYKDFAAAYLLNSKGAYQPATIILENTLEQAMKYEYVELCAEITRTLRFNYNRFAPNSPKHKQYIKLHQEFEKKRYWEIHANDQYETLIALYQSRQYPKSDLAKEANKFYNELAPNLNSVNTGSYIFYTYLCGLIGLFAENNISEAYEFSTEGLRKLEQNPNVTPGALTTIALQKMVCMVQLKHKNHIENNEFFDKFITIIQPGSFNWYKIHEIYFYYNSYTKRYKDCLTIYQTVIKQPNYGNLPAKSQEMWRLMGQYLQILAKASVLPAEETYAIVGPPKLGRFLNELDLLNQDTSGMNIPILLLPFIYQILGDRDADAIRSWEALEQYRKRHLKSKANERSNSFIKILYALSQQYSTKKSAEKIISREVKILQDNAPKIAGQTLWIEIIPYEDLWDILKKFTPKW